MHNLKPKKRLGQHFLRDDNISRKIADLCPAASNEPVVEIGPGGGAMTRFLSEKFSRLTLVEYDPEAVEVLKERFPDTEIVQADFLKWDIATALKRPAHFIGNLPYNISSPILFHLLENRNKVMSGVFMVQKEVAERIAAPPGGKDYGILSVLLGHYFELKYAFKVSPQVFHPPPRVMSAVFTMMPRPGRGEQVAYKALHTVVKAAFGKRRKTLRNALSGLNFKEGAFPEAWLGLRAEQLPVDDFVTLAQALIHE